MIWRIRGEKVGRARFLTDELGELRRIALFVFTSDAEADAAIADLVVRFVGKSVRVEGTRDRIVRGLVARAERSPVLLDVAEATDRRGTLLSALASLSPRERAVLAGVPADDLGLAEGSWDVAYGHLAATLRARGHDVDAYEAGPGSVAEQVARSANTVRPADPRADGDISIVVTGHADDSAFRPPA